MKLIIIENDKNDLSNLLKLIHGFESKYESSLDIKVEKDYSSIFNYVNDYDVIFLDIELENNINGIELARKIRKQNRDIKIVFVSNYSRYLIDGYSAKADLYLLKPIDKNEFNKNMKTILWDYTYHDMGITDTSLKQTKIYFRDISYIEVLQRKLYIHFINGETISCYDTLSKWKDILKDAPFAQPHRSFLVNMREISQYKSKSIQLKNDYIIPVTDVFSDSFRENYIKFLNGLMI